MKTRLITGEFKTSFIRDSWFHAWKPGSQHADNSLSANNIHSFRHLPNILHCKAWYLTSPQTWNGWRCGKIQSHSISIHLFAKAMSISTWNKVSKEHLSPTSTRILKDRASEKSKTFCHLSCKRSDINYLTCSSYISSNLWRGRVHFF